jgi:enoyl-CoA hydratase
MSAAPLVIRSDPRPRVALLTLNRPERKNALSEALMAELAAHLERIEPDEAIGAVAITGGEDVFAAGADIADFRGRPGIAVERDGMFAAWDRLWAFRKPLVAAVAGFAFGGGLELALACDLIVAAENARFAQPEIRLGLMPGAGGTQRLTRVIGKALAMEMVLLGRELAPGDALAFGLVNRVVPQGQAVAAALELAAQAAHAPAFAARLAKASVLRAFETPLGAGLAAERAAFAALLDSDDAREGIAAFFERRAPEWSGR